MKRNRFVFINYIGADVSITKKAKVSTHKGAITSGFGVRFCCLQFDWLIEKRGEITRRFT